jgi:hypothetical protein
LASGNMAGRPSLRAPVRKSRAPLGAAPLSKKAPFFHISLISVGHMSKAGGHALGFPWIPRRLEAPWGSFGPGPFELAHTSLRANSSHHLSVDPWPEARLVKTVGTLCEDPFRTNPRFWINSTLGAKFRYWTPVFHTELVFCGKGTANIMEKFLIRNFRLSLGRGSRP